MGVAEADFGCGRVAGLGCATSTGADLRVLTGEAFTSARDNSMRISALRAPALAPPNTAPTTCRLPRRTDEIRLKPERRV
jgi:hypothetical protein